MANAAKTKAGDVAEKLYLIDGSGFIFRAFHSSPLDAFRRTDGIYTNAVAGYCGMLLKLIDQARNDGAFDYMAVIFDAGRKTFRNDIYPEYKANRDAPPEELVPQFEMVREATRAFNLPAVQMDGFEADDLIATYAKEAAARGIDVVVVSSDKDLMQLVRPGISMLDPMKDVVIGAPEVAEKFGVAPDKVIDVQSLAGDSTDNVPGVPGIGVKTAALLINEYGDLDTLLARAEEIKQNKRRENLIEFAEQARVSRELVTLKNDVAVEADIDSFALKDPDPATVIAFLKEMEFRTLTARVESRFVAEGLLDQGTLAAAAAATAETEYELVQDDAALAKWIDAAYAAGTVAFDTETTSINAIAVHRPGQWLLCAGWPCGRRADRARSRRHARQWRRQGQRRHQADTPGHGPGAAQGADRGPVGAQDRPQREIRSAGADPRLRETPARRAAPGAGGDRRHHAVELCARRRARQA
jgi:DNA polymerase-1